MKKIAVLMIVLALIGLQNVYAGLTYEVGFVTSYVWRGFDMYPKNKPAIQPSITYQVGKSGFSINMWASFAMSDREELKELEEIDFTLNYDFQLSENVALSVGMINYGFYWIDDYTFKDGNTQEFYVTAGLPKMIFNPSISVYLDINLGDGLYIALSGGHSFKLSEKTNLELSATLGYNGKQWMDESGISDLNFSAALPLTVGKFSIAPSINYTHVFLEPLYREGDKKEKLWAAVTIGIN
ncbi:MAG: hypothetical protein GY765_06890 [bacterium]|nr:hypothetical protein [bacterium]